MKIVFGLFLFNLPFYQSDQERAWKVLNTGSGENSAGTL
jgi:hypothetical protein